MSSETPAIRCADLGRRFGSLTAVDGISLEVARGTVFGFLGPNGAGKTTTIRLLLGLIAPTSGSVTVLGCDLPAGGGEVRRRTGVLLEHHGLYEGLSVRASLVFAARAYGLTEREATGRVNEVVEGLGLADRLGDRPSLLSRGMRQRMALARALVGRPELLILDEPTNGLDAAAAAALRAEIGDLVDGGTTVFLTTHLLAEAERLCDQVAVVKAGRIVATGAPTDLRRGAHVQRVRIEGLGIARLGPALAGGDWQVQGADVIEVAVESLDAVPAVVATLVRAGAAVTRVEPVGQTLEAAFLQLVDAAPADDEPVRTDGGPA